MSSLPPGVIGTGQTKYKKARLDVSMPGLLREAAQRALDDAGLDWPDIDAVVFGKAPDLFEGVMHARYRPGEVLHRGVRGMSSCLRCRGRPG
jgi:acetyl-CoA acetyltransferase